MLDTPTTQAPLKGRKPLSGAGVGFKPCHVHDILNDPSCVDWFEVHAENYMGAGGPPHHWLGKIRERFPLSVHGVGLSIGGSDGLDMGHLQRLKTVVDRYAPELVSEHLAWSSHQGQYYNDLLALPYTTETLRCVCDHIDQVQNFLDRKILLENPSTYIIFDESEIDETDFISEVVQKTGCGLLLDVNNVFVTSTNHGRDAVSYIHNLPLSSVGEIHLAGHAEDASSDEKPLLIDAHDRAVADPVWHLYELLLQKVGPVPTLVEWDNDLPDWPTLKSEAEKVKTRLKAVKTVKKEAQYVA